MRFQILMFAGVLLASSAAIAQYKVIGPDGKISYTDTPPASPNVKAVGRGAGDGIDTENLPYELRQVLGRYPVTLMTTSNCTACDNARSFLRQRGVPYTEKTVTTSQDIAALQRNEGGNDLPVVRIGGQQLKGFQATDWGSYLDAAGYPKQSKLPPSYKFREPVPMVQAEATPSQGTGAVPGTASPQPVSVESPPPVDGSNSPPIKF